MTTYKMGDILLVNFVYSSSVQSKKRPALVILDINDADIILAPITTKERKEAGDYKLKDWNHSGLLKESWVRLAKVACLNKTNILCRLGKLTDYDKYVISEIWHKLYLL